MDLLKKLVRIKYNDDENIPEIHLIKNEIKHYYDPIKKKWIFEGEEEEERQIEKLPPKINNVSKNKKNSYKKRACIFNDEIIVNSGGNDKINSSYSDENIKIFKKKNENIILK